MFMDTTVDRRFFIKLLAGTAAVASIGLTLPKGMTGLVDVDRQVRPRLRSDLRVVPTAQGADILAGGTLVSTVNHEGAALLGLADGRTTLAGICAHAEYGSVPDIATFFITLSSAGLLEEQLAVQMVEKRVEKHVSPARAVHTAAR